MVAVNFFWLAPLANLSLSSHFQDDGATDRYASPDPASSSMLLGLKGWKKEAEKDRSEVLIKTDVLGGPHRGIWGEQASLRLAPALIKSE